MSILDILRSDGSIVVNKFLIKAIGLHEAIVLSELISRNLYYAELDQLDENGMFFCTVEKMEENTTLSKHQQLKAINNLKELKLIESKQKGIPAKRFFKVNESAVEGIIKGKKSEKPHGSKKLKKSPTGSSIIDELEVKKVDSNNTYITNTEDKNNTSNFSNSTHSFLNEYDSNYKEEIEDSIATYYGQYQRYTGNVHPKLKEDQLQRVYDVFHGALYEWGSLDDMIKEFFRTVKNTDYNINHFATEGMLEILNYRVM